MARTNFFCEQKVNRKTNPSFLSCKSRNQNVITLYAQEGKSRDRFGKVGKHEREKEGKVGKSREKQQTKNRKKNLEKYGKS